MYVPPSASAVGDLVSSLKPNTQDIAYNHDRDCDASRIDEERPESSLRKSTESIDLAKSFEHSNAKLENIG